MLRRYHTGFTVVELLIVIVVIGILASVGTVGYRGLQARASDTEIKSDANNVKDKIEIAFLKNNAYPANLGELGAITKAATTTLNYQTTGQAYCLTVTSTKSGSKTYSVASEGKVIEGDCTAAGYTAPIAPPSQPNATIGAINTNSFTVNWSATTGATSYTVRYGTSSPTSVASSCSSLSCNISGLSPNTTYYVTVSANNTAGSTTSVQRTARTTGTYVGSAPGPIIGCAYPSGGTNVGWNKTSGAAKLRLYIEDYNGEIDEVLDPDPYYTNLFTYDFGQSGGGTITATVSFIDTNGNESPTTTSSVTINATDCYD